MAFTGCLCGACPGCLHAQGIDDSDEHPTPLDAWKAEEEAAEAGTLLDLGAGVTAGI